MAEGEGKKDNIIDLEKGKDYQVVGEERKPAESDDLLNEIPDESKKNASSFLEALAAGVAEAQGRKDKSVPESWKRRFGVGKNPKRSSERPALTTSSKSKPK